MPETFLYLEKIKGESIDAVGGGPPHIDDIEVIDWEWGIGNSADLKDRDTEKEKLTKHTSFNDLKIIKWIDLATPTLLYYCSVGKHITNATLTCRKQAGDYKFEYYVVDFTDLKIMGVKWERGEDKKEEITFKFATFKVKYKMQDNSGEGAGTNDFGFDITTHEPK